MKKRGTINSKFARVILIPLLLVLLVGSVVLITVMSSMSTSSINELTEELIESRVNESMRRFDIITTEASGLISLLASVVESAPREEEFSRDKVVQSLAGAMLDNDALQMVWTCWEPNSFDGRDEEYSDKIYYDKSGRFASYIVKTDKSYQIYPLENYTTGPRAECYQGVIDTGKVYVSDPYNYMIEGEECLVYSVAAPIFNNGKTVGVVGTDIPVDRIDEIVKNEKIMDNGYIFLVSPSGHIVSHKESQYVMKNYTEVFYEGMIEQILLVFNDSDITATWTRSKVLDEEIYFYAAKDAISKTSRHWVMCGVVPASTVNKSANRLIIFVVVIYTILICIILLSFWFMFYAKNLSIERDKATEDARAKSAFLANMSHEIRTPLNAVIGMTKIAKESNEKERIRYCLNKIDESSIHLLGVINDVLDMSKIGAGKFELTLSEFPIEKVIQQTVTVMNFKMNEKKQRFIIKVDKDVPYAIIADIQRLAQVITNLLSNACKFTPDGGKIFMYIHSVSQNDAESVLKFVIKDTGIGISEETQKKLFQSFEQGDGSISRRFGGTGLGLAISKSIVESMDGEIWVESIPDEGSIFTFTARVGVGTILQQGVNTVLPNGAIIKVLIVDSDVETREYIKETIQSLGILCEAAANGKEAIDILNQREQFHLVLISNTLDDMDWLFVAKKMKEKYADIEIIIMLAGALWEDIRDRANKVGVTECLVKPVLSSMIVESVERLTNKDEPKRENENVFIKEVFAGKNILFAEDVDINREIVMTLLEDTKLNIDCAENGKVACEMFEENPDKYDLILMDIQMPEMDGYEATRTIRNMNNKYAKEIPIIAMTANVFREDIDACIESGMNDHVGKPVDVKELMIKLTLYLNN